MLARPHVKPTGKTPLELPPGASLCQTCVFHHEVGADIQQYDGCVRLPGRVTWPSRSACNLLDRPRGPLQTPAPAGGDQGARYGVGVRGRWKRPFEFSILQRSGGRQTHVHQRWRGPRALPRAAQGLYPRLLRPAVCRGRQLRLWPTRGMRRQDPGLPRRRGEDRHARPNLARRGAGEAYCPRGGAALAVMQGQQ